MSRRAYVSLLQRLPVCFRACPDVRKRFIKTHPLNFIPGPIAVYFTNRVSCMQELPKLAE